MEGVSKFDFEGNTVQYKHCATGRTVNGFGEKESDPTAHSTCSSKVETRKVREQRSQLHGQAKDLNIVKQAIGTSSSVTNDL